MSKPAFFLFFLGLMSAVAIETRALSFYNYWTDIVNHYAEEESAAQAVDESCQISGAHNLCQSAKFDREGQIDYFHICPHDGKDCIKDNVCYHTDIPECCQVGQLDDCHSTRQLTVLGTDYNLTVYNVFTIDEVIKETACFVIDPIVDVCEDDCVKTCAKTELCENNTENCVVNGNCVCKEGYQPNDCCDCSVGNKTHGWYKAENGSCLPFCRPNCQQKGPCLTCSNGYLPIDCCSCPPNQIEIKGANGIGVCTQPKCQKDQDLYFLIDATISNSYQDFCQSMVVFQVIAAALNPTGSSGTKLYGVLFQPDATDSVLVEEVFALDSNCSDVVSNHLPMLIKDFASCKKSIYKARVYKSMCAQNTIAINGLKKIETVARESSSKEKAVIILTDGTIEDPHNQLNTVKESLRNAGIETMIAARVGTNKVDPNLAQYANNDSNAIAADTPIGLGHKIVERLSAEGILCEDHAQNITNSLNKASKNETNFPYICHCLPQVFPDGEECQLFSGGNKYPTTIQYPNCGGSLEIGIDIDLEIPAKQEYAKEVEDYVLEAQILAAVKKVLKIFYHG